MTFFPEIDVKKTKANAKRKLREYPRWRRIANDNEEQKVTATYSFEPRQPFGKPSQPVERLAINKISADSELEAIEQAVARLFNPYHRRILFDRYLRTHTYSDYQIYTELGYERSRYYDMVDEALLAFAEQYKNGVLIVEIGQFTDK